MFSSHELVEPGGEKSVKDSCEGVEDDGQSLDRSLVAVVKAKHAEDDEVEGLVWDGENNN